MTSEDLTPYIETNTHQFWGNSVNPKNTDSVFFQSQITTVQNALKKLKNEEGGVWIVNSFLNNSYILKDEYFVNYMPNIVLTNFRIFFWYKDLKVVIPLKNLISYTKIDNGLTVEYNENNAKQTFRLANTWLKADMVNNAMNRHKDAILNEEQLIIASNIKSTLNALYSISEDMTPDAVSPAKTKRELPEIPNFKIPIKPLLAVCLFVSLFGGCYYYYDKQDKQNTINNAMNSNRVGYDSITGKKMKKCPWCGGIGRVGYAGDSKAQVEKTGMGLGNECTVCQGTGYVKDDDGN